MAAKLSPAAVSSEAEVLFENLSKYLKGELSSASVDFKLLEQMNVITKDKYQEMAKSAELLVAAMGQLQKKYAAFEPFLAQIDEIDASVKELEETVLLLDQYTSRLEFKFSEMERRTAKD